MIIFQILIVLGFILLIIYSIISTIRDLKTVTLNAQLLARQKQPKQKRYEFIEDETEEDTAFGVPIDMLEENET